MQVSSRYGHPSGPQATAAVTHPPIAAVTAAASSAASRGCGDFLRCRRQAVQASTTAAAVA